MKNRVISVFLTSICLILAVIPNAIADSQPTYKWISKVPQKSKDCYFSGYCLVLQIDPNWIKNCLDRHGDDVSVEIYYLNNKGQLIRNGIDPSGKIIKGKLTHFPSANKSVHDNIGSERPIKFQKAIVNQVTCVSY